MANRNYMSAVCRKASFPVQSRLSEPLSEVRFAANPLKVTVPPKKLRPVIFTVSPGKPCAGVKSVITGAP